MTVHTIWVPKGWSVEQTWERIRRGDKWPPWPPPKGVKSGRWVNVDENGWEIKRA